MADKIVFVIGLLVKQQFFQAAQEKQTQRHADISGIAAFRQQHKHKRGDPAVPPFFVGIGSHAGKQQRPGVDVGAGQVKV